MGWIGNVQELAHTLRSMGAEVDEEGRVKISGDAATFMGVGPEVVIGDEAYCIIDGQRVYIAEIMGGTSYGQGATVII